MYSNESIVGGIKFMTFFKGVAAMAATALLLCSCANRGTPELPFDRAQSGNVKVIGLVKPASPDHAAAPIPVAATGGLAGLLVAGTIAVMRSNRESSLDTIVKSHNFNFADHFVETIVAELTRQGYAVKTVDLPRSGFKPIAKEALAARTDLGVDAVLDISVSGYGYAAASNSDDAPYRPFVAASVQLVRANGGNDVLMKDIVVYNPYNNPKDVVSIPPDPQYNFVHFSDIEADPSNAIGGMTVAAEQTGQAIAHLLK